MSFLLVRIILSYEFFINWQAILNHLSWEGNFIILMQEQIKTFLASKGVPQMVIDQIMPHLAGFTSPAEMLPMLASLKDKLPEGTLEHLMEFATPEKLGFLAKIMSFLGLKK